MSKTEKIFVTGAHGFLGQHVMKELKKSYRHAIFFTPPHEILDLLNKSDVYFYIHSIKPDYVIHLAAKVGGIGANQRSPASFLYENLIMGVNLINAAYQNDVKKFINLSTVCSYPKFTPVPFKEEALWNGYPEETNAPYGLAKKMLMVMGQSYWQQYTFKCITLIPTNLYGPGDNFDPSSSHVIPALIYKIANAVVNKEPFIRVWGTGKATREFLYVEDCARAIVAALQKYEDPMQPLNIGSGYETSIEELVKTICREMKYDGWIDYESNLPDGQPRRRLDNSLAKKYLGWEAKTPFKIGLKKTIKWFNTECPYLKNNPSMSVSDMMQAMKKDPKQLQGNL